MVQTGVAAAGSALLAGGVGLMVAAAMMETFVVVTVPGAPDCEVDYLGQLGIYTASYDPKCAASHPDPSVGALYANVEKLESVPTTEFPLLFASQEGVPMLNNGEPLDFEDCETFWAEGGAAENAAFLAAQGQVVSGVEEGLASAGAIVAEIPSSLGAVGDFVTGLWLQSALGGLADLEPFGVTSGSTLQTIVATVNGVLTTQLLPVAPTVSCGTDMSSTGITNCKPLAPIPNAIDCTCDTDQANQCNVDVQTVAQIPTPINQTTCLGAQAVFLANVQDAAVYGFVNATQGKAAADLTLAGLQNPATRSATQQSVADTYEESVNSLKGAALLYGIGTQTLNVSAAAAEGIYTLPEDFQAVSNDDLCILLFLDFSQETSQFSYDAAAQIAFGDFANEPPLAPCSFKVAASVLASNSAALESQLLGGLDLSDSPIPVALVSQLVAGLMNELAECANGVAADAGTTGCVNATVFGINQTAFPATLQVTGIPEDYTSPDWFFARVFGVSSGTEALEFFGAQFPEDSTERSGFQAAAGLLNVCGAAAQGAQAAGDFTTAAALASKSGCLAALADQKYALFDSVEEGLVTATAPALVGVQSANCSDVLGKPTLVTVAGQLAALGLQFNTSKDCEDLQSDMVVGIAELRGGPKFLYNQLVAAASDSILGDSSTNELRISSCEDDTTDKQIFELAQKMVPGAIALAGFGLVLSFAAIGTQKNVLAILGGVLGVLGGGLLLGALFYVRSAPVYSLVGGDPVDGQALYQGGLAQTLALGAVGAPIVGGLLVLGSSFCGGSSESSALTTGKVDGTY